MIGLSHPKTSANVGSVIRGAYNFGISGVYFTGQRYERAGTDTQKGVRHMPVTHVEDLQNVIPFGCVPVAVELLAEAQSLVDYVHPERGFYIFGPEDGTLGKAITSWCRDIIYIPTKSCLNLAVTTQIVMYDRMAKAYRTQETTKENPSCTS